MMNTNEREDLELNPTLSILQRLDRLERVLLFLEEKKCSTAGHSAVAVGKCSEPDEQCKSLSYALEEAQHKGTLLERVALLENRVIKLSIDLELGNTSRSSSSTSLVAEKLESCPSRENQDPIMTQDSSVNVEACSLNSPSCRRRVKATSRTGYNRKWLKWLILGC